MQAEFSVRDHVGTRDRSAPVHLEMFLPKAVQRCSTLMSTIVQVYILAPGTSAFSALKSFGVLCCWAVGFFEVRGSSKASDRFHNHTVTF